MKKYLAILLSVLILGIFGAAGTNYVVNPYGIYHDGNYEQDLFPQKPEIHNHVRMVKAHQLASQKPETIIIGSSRAQYGFDPARLGHAYNLSIPGAALYELRRYIEFASTQRETKRIIFSADFFMFNALYPVKPDFSEERLIDIQNADFKTLFSVSTLWHSLQTARLQKNGTEMKLSGQMKSDEKNKANAKTGYHQAFLNNERSYLNTVYFPPPHEAFSFQSNDGRSSFEDFSAILDLCQKKNIDLTILIPPPHARLLILIEQSGLWPQYEEWKRRMVEINAERYPLWDFSGFNMYAVEDVSDDMRYYWEGSHFKPALGNLILDIVTNKKSDPNFGVQLNNGNIRNWLLDTQRAKQSYMASHPKEVEEISDIVKRFGP